MNRLSDMYKKAVLFLNGNAPSSDTLAAIKEEIAASGVFAACADGAFYYLRDYFLPHIIIADFDSSNKCDIPKGIEILKLNVEKDYTDGHAAMQYLIDEGIKNVQIYGADGGRADHILANYSLLALAQKNKIDALIVTQHFIIKLASGSFSQEMEIGKTVSLVPFTDNVHIQYTKGLKYELTDKTLDKTHILGISNIAISRNIEFGITSGAALIFLER